MLNAKAKVKNSKIHLLVVYFALSVVVQNFLPDRRSQTTCTTACGCLESTSTGATAPRRLLIADWLPDIPSNGKCSNAKMPNAQMLKCQMQKYQMPMQNAKCKNAKCQMQKRQIPNGKWQMLKYQMQKRQIPNAEC